MAQIRISVGADCLCLQYIHLSAFQTTSHKAGRTSRTHEKDAAQGFFRDTVMVFMI